MALTGILMTAIFVRRRRYGHAALAWGITLLDLAFLGASLSKLPPAATGRSCIAAVPLTVILIYLSGQRRLYRGLPADAAPRVPARVPRDLRHHEPDQRHGALLRPRRRSGSRRTSRGPCSSTTSSTRTTSWSRSWSQDAPFGVTSDFKRNLAEGLRIFEIRHGYLEFVDIVPILRDHGIHEKAIFYGLEEIATDRLVWRIFALIKRLAPTFVQFYRLPADHLHGVSTRIEM